MPESAAAVAACGCMCAGDFLGVDRLPPARLLRCSVLTAWGGRLCTSFIGFLRIGLALIQVITSLVQSKVNIGSMHIHKSFCTTSLVTLYLRAKCDPSIHPSICPGERASSRCHHRHLRQYGRCLAHLEQRLLPGQSRSRKRDCEEGERVSGSDNFNIAVELW